MRKLFFFCLLSIISFGAYSQVFNSAKTLPKNTFVIGVEPMVMAKNGSDFIFFGHFGYGLDKNIDLGAKVGVFGYSEYFGVDAEFAFMKNMSISAGAHLWGDFGLDLSYLASFTVAKDVDLYFGADGDLNFNDGAYFNFWIPVGVEVSINKNMAFILESSIGLSSGAPHMFGGGVNVYF